MGPVNDSLGTNTQQNFHPIFVNLKVSLLSESRLIHHYEKTLGATHIGGQKMIIFPSEALALVKKYYPQ